VISLGERVRPGNLESLTPGYVVLAVVVLIGAVTWVTRPVDAAAVNAHRPATLPRAMTPLRLLLETSIDLPDLASRNFAATGFCPDTDLTLVIHLQVRIRSLRVDELKSEEARLFFWSLTHVPELQRAWRRLVGVDDIYLVISVDGQVEGAVLTVVRGTNPDDLRVGRVLNLEMPRSQRTDVGIGPDRQLRAIELEEVSYLSGLLAA